ncbi:uncharacterized protein [Diadema antillarum]|uniref:uncharacterized protein n=1 Tax=Diadema antillarum TaxID=105358 RepID=UPI003A8B44F8
MADDPTTISRFRWLIVYLSGEFTAEDLDRAKSLVKDRLGARYQKIDEPLKFFDALEEENLIHEGDTEYLKTLLHYSSRDDLIIEVESYERERKVVCRQFSRNPLLRDGPFFGRKVIMDRIVGILDQSYDHIHCIGISGMPGSGKTRLAKEATYRLLRYGEVIFVDLRELQHVEDIFFSIMSRLGKECRDFEPDLLYSTFRFYDPKKHAGAVIILDNADKPLDPGTDEKPNEVYGYFVRMIENILNLPNSKVKLVITSRVGLEHTHINSRHLQCFRLEGENELDLEDAVEIVKYHAGKTEVKDDEAVKLVELCGKIPLALKVVSSRFQDGTISPHEMIRHLSHRNDDQAQRLVGSLSHLGLAKADQLTMSLLSTVERLPIVHQRNIIRLSVVPGSFDMKAAQEILGYPKNDPVGLKLDLQALKYRSLLESGLEETEGKISSDSPRYSIHLLLRSFLQQMCADDTQDLAKEYAKGEQGFIQHFGKKMRRTTKTFQKDFRKALASKQNEKANFMYLLNCIKTKHLPTEKESDWLHTAVELMMVPKERLSFYRTCKQRAKAEGQLAIYAEFCCFESQQLLDLGFDVQVILPLFDEAEEILAELPNQDSDSVQLSYATLYHFRGNLFARRLKATDALKPLEKALKIRKKVLGDNFLTARTLNVLGQAMHSAAHVENMGYIHQDMLRAIDYYRRAVDMCTRITGSEKHVDIPTFLLNIGACLHEMSRYKQAIEYFKKSLDLETQLGMDGTTETCVTLKNMAMSYFVEEKYDDAIPLALRALEGRQKLHGVHPNTARSLYFVGSIYLASKKYRDARTYFDKALEMEETLWSRGMPHSPDWDLLKEKFRRLLVSQGNNQALHRYHKRFKAADKKSNQGEISGWIDRDEDDSVSSSSSSSGGKRRTWSSSKSSSSSMSSAKQEKPAGQRSGDQTDSSRRLQDEADNASVGRGDDLPRVQRSAGPEDSAEGDPIPETGQGMAIDGDMNVQIETISLSSNYSEYSGVPPVRIRFGQMEDHTDEGSTTDEEEKERKRQRKRAKKEREAKRETPPEKPRDDDGEFYDWNKSSCHVM